MEKEIVIDGTNATLGRLASYAAKQSLLGSSVIIVNANRVVIVGSKADIIDKYKKSISRGGTSMKGPNIIRTPERILKRTVRGMLSYKDGRGSAAIDRVICYNETPAKYENVKKIIAGKEKSGKFITLKELVERIK
ncbi:MAG: 50S ribosomal protein L13 [Candidatus Pacearchaeota archaeon]|jgi:large subunit ribosomal protein L13